MRRNWGPASAGIRSEDALESMYEEVLGFLESHPEHPAELSRRLIGVMGRYRFGRDKQQSLLPSAAIAYSMHVLRSSSWQHVAVRSNIERMQLRAVVSDVFWRSSYSL